MTTPGRATTPRRRWLRVALLTAASMVVIVCGSIAFALYYYHRNHYSFRHIRLDMTETQVESVFGRSADCTAGLGAARVLVFLDPAHDGRGCEGVGPTYDTPAQLPWIYSSVQVVVDRHGKVSAFVHVGESETIARVPEKSGGTLAGLPLASVE